MTNLQFSQLTADELISLILRAVSDGQLHLLSEVLQVHAYRDDLRGLAVVHAAKIGHLEVIQELLKENISQEDRGEAVIHAAREGHLQVAQELLKNKALITPEDWKYALRCAVENEHLEIVRELAENVPISSHSKVPKSSLKRQSDPS